VKGSSFARDPLADHPSFFVYENAHEMIDSFRVVEGREMKRPMDIKWSCLKVINRRRLLTQLDISGQFFV